MNLKFIRHPFLLVMPVILLASTAAFSGWNKVFQFTQPVRTIYFLDKIGHPEIGYCGLNDGELWNTADGGKTWTKVFTDPNGLSVSDITFKDINTGWFTTKPLPTQLGAGIIYNTSDGGVSWSLQKAGGAFSSVNYNPFSGILFISEWFIGAYQSSDDGASWSTFTNQGPLNGYTFSNGLNGIVTFTLPPTSSLMVTADGGMTWNMVNTPRAMASCWQSAAIKGTNTFFVFSEYTGALTRSDDGGRNWRIIDSLGNGAQYQFTGCLRISDCGEFFVQSADLNNGLYTSFDEGVTWISINGPSSESDTRFWIDEQTVFAADVNGGLFSFDAGAAILRILRDTFFVNSLDCKPVIANLGFASLSCIQGADSLIRDTATGAFSVNPGFIPQEFTGNGAASLIYTPSGKGRDTGLLSLRFKLHGKVIDTSIVVIGTSPKQIHALSVDASPFILRTANCVPVDSAIQIFSFTNCEPGIDTIIGADFIPGTGFLVSSTEIIPRPFTNHDSIKIHYQPSGAITDTGLFLLRTILGGKEFDTIMRIVATSNKPVASFSVVLLPVIDTTFGVALSADVPTSEGLDSLWFDLHFNTEMVQLDGVIEPSGFAISTQEIMPGWWKCRFYNIGHTGILANQSLGTFYFLKYITLDTVSIISLLPGDAFFDSRIHTGCSIASMPRSDSVLVAASNDCGDHTLHHFLVTGKLDITLLSIRPNPAHDEIIIETESAAPQEANIIIYDDMGKEYIKRSQSFAGRNNLTIPISSLGSGNYHCMIKSSTGSASSDFVKLR